jgi:antitoxin MazE
MQISKLDDTLIVRLPDHVVESLDLKEGDEVELHVTQKRAVEPVSDITREEAVERLRAMSIHFPPDFKFNREEANSR